MTTNTPPPPRRGRARMQLHEGRDRWLQPSEKRYIERHVKRIRGAFFRDLLRRHPVANSYLDLTRISGDFLLELMCLNKEPFTPDRTPEEQARAIRDQTTFNRGGTRDGLLLNIRDHDGNVITCGFTNMHRLGRAYNAHRQALLWQWREQGNSTEMPEILFTPQDEWGWLEIAYKERLQDQAKDEFKAANAYMVAEEAQLQADMKTLAKVMKPVERAMYDTCPPDENGPEEPWMNDGSHLLACERGRRRYHPVTGERQIKEMVLTPEEWPHYRWVPDVEGAEGIGPYGPNCTVSKPEDPRRPSPREEARPHLEKIGRLDLLEKYSDLRWKP